MVSWTPTRNEFDYKMEPWTLLLLFITRGVPAVCAQPQCRHTQAFVWRCFFCLLKNVHFTQQFKATIRKSCFFYLRDPWCCITAQPDFLAFASRKCELVTSSQLGPEDVVAAGTNTVEDPKPLLVQAYIDICFHTYLIMQLIVAWVSTSCLKARLIGCLQPLSWT